MKTTDLYANLEKLIPAELCCPWDNDGLSVLPRPDHESRRVLVSLDVREEVINYAKENGFDTLVTHHPLIFSGLKELAGGTVVSGKAAELIRADLAAMSFHTRFDALDGGVTDVLCETLGLVPAGKFGEGGVGRICETEETTLSDFASKAKALFGDAHFFCEKGGETVKKIAVCGGSAGDLVPAALAAGCDLLFCGEMRYHSAIDAADAGLSVVCVGHYESEAPALMRLSELVREALGAACDILICREVRYLSKSDAADAGLSAVCAGRRVSVTPAPVRDTGAEEIVIYGVKQYAV